MDRTSVAIIFHRLGPYHQARLKAAARLCHVLAIEEGDHTSEYAWDKVSSAGEGFERITLVHEDDPPQRQLAKTLARRIRAALQRHRPEVIAIPGWSDPAALAALGWGLAHGVPCVVMSESTAFDEPRRPWKEWVKSRVVRLCSAGLAGGTPHVEYLQTLGLPREQVFTGYDAVDNDHFFAGAQAARANEESERARLQLPPRFLLASSRFVAQKNLSTLLESFARYSQEAGAGAWKLVLLGDGPLRAELLELRRTLNLTEAVLLPGFKQYHELPAYYGLAGAFVHASTREPWGLVVNEAMAAGLPVLVSGRCGCARDLVVPGENGFVFDPADPRELTARITQVTRASAEARAGMGAASRRLVGEWSPARFAENLVLAADAARRLPPKQLSSLDSLLLRMLIQRAEGHARRLLPVAP